MYVARYILKCILFRLLQYVDLFLSEAVGDVAPHVARLLREVFSAGPTSSLRVTECQIKTIMGRIFLRSAEFGNGSITREGKAELVRLLQELVTVRSACMSEARCWAV